VTKPRLAGKHQEQAAEHSSTRILGSVALFDELCVKASAVTSEFVRADHRHESPTMPPSESVVIFGLSRSEQLTEQDSTPWCGNWQRAKKLL
jgi:hypothetical protein